MKTESEREEKERSGFNLCGCTFYWHKLAVSVMFLQIEKNQSNPESLVYMTELKGI